MEIIIRADFQALRMVYSPHGLRTREASEERLLPGELVIEHVGEPLEENQRQNEVPTLRRIRSPANRAHRIPKPCFQRGA